MEKTVVYYYASVRKTNSRYAREILGEGFVKNIQ